VRLFSFSFFLVVMIGLWGLRIWKAFCGVPFCGDFVSLALAICSITNYFAEKKFCSSLKAYASKVLYFHDGLTSISHMITSIW
jgi:hypothetical protein